MNNTKKFIDVLKEVTVSGKTTQLMQAKVVSVEEDNTCTIAPSHADDVNIAGVQLQAVTGAAYGFCLKPAAGSNVLYQRIGESDRYCISHTDELDGLNLSIGEHSLVIDSGSDAIKFNGGVNGPLLISSTVYEELKIIKTDINDLKDLITLWAPPAGPILNVASDFKAHFLNWTSNDLEIDIENFDNPKITH